MSPALPTDNRLNDRGKCGVRVLVVTGASGGHMFPALSFLDTLKEKNKEVDTLLVLSKRSIKTKIVPDNYKVRYLSISPITLRLNLENFVSILRFIKGCFESLFLLLEFKPDIVVGFGSLDSVPLLLLAWLVRIKTLIHEQNLILGRANRLLVKFVDRIAISFIQTKEYLKINPAKIVFTGNPIRTEFKNIDKFKALSYFGFNENKFTMLVMGGSQGSHRINMCFLKAISMMPDKFKLQVVHIAGAKDYGLLDTSYRDIGVKIKLFSFLKEIQYAYNACSLVICRAGATTISELIFYKIPAIIIPYPFAYKHQLSNAQVLERVGAAIVIEDNKLEADILRDVLVDLMNNPNKISFMRSRYDNITRLNAGDSLREAVLSLN